MKKRYSSWALIISVLSLAFLMAQGASANSPTSFKYRNPDIIEYENYRPLLFLEHGAMREDFQLAGHRSHSSHRSHASHSSHRSGSYSTSAPRTYSPPPEVTPEPSPNTNNSPKVPPASSSEFSSKSSTSASGAPPKSINSLITPKPKYSIKMKNGSLWKANLTSKADDKVELTLEDGMSVWVRSSDIAQIVDSQTGSVVYP